MVYQVGKAIHLDSPEFGRATPLSQVTGKLRKYHSKAQYCVRLQSIGSIGRILLQHHQQSHARNARFR